MKLDLLPGNAAADSLAHRREIAEVVVIRITVPRSEQRIFLALVGVEIGDGDTRADVCSLRGGGGLVHATGAVDFVFHIGLLRQEHFLMFLGCLELGILAKVAVLARNLDFLGVGGYLFLN